MEVYEIWSEGFSATGESGNATFWGDSLGYTFRDACQRYADCYPDFRKLFDAEQLTWWGCRLFDNEEDARKAFG